MGIKYIGKTLLIEEKGEKIMVVGDLHLGYEESLELSGVSFSEKMFKDMKEYFESVFEMAGKVDKIVLLGDVKHGFSENTREEWQKVLELFDYLLQYCEEIVICRGNHDNYLKTIAGKRNIRVEDMFLIGEYCFVHGDKEDDVMLDDEIKVWVMGHGHPAIRLTDGTKEEKYKCFLVGEFKDKKVIIVPSFVEYNEGTDPRENDLGFPWAFDLNKFEVKVVGEELAVLNFGKLGKIK